MYTVTYSLKDKDSDSNNYYKKIAVFTDEVLMEADVLLNTYINAYKNYLINSSEAGDKASINIRKATLHDKNLQEVSPFGEASPYMGEAAANIEFLELLILGVLWSVYCGDAMELNEAPQQVLTMLAENRNNNIKIKPGIDFLRGIASTLFLSPDLYDNMSLINPDMIKYEKLLLWLEATGEFIQEVKRLRRWKIYLSTLPQSKAIEIIAAAITFALWFEKRSEECIGTYTENVERYLNEIRPKKYWCEDVIFCGRRRVEYHLNMVGAEIMNRVYRDEFLKTEKKLLLLPSCMRLHGSKCPAKSHDGVICCVKCAKDCHVCQLNVLGEANHYKVAIVPHESSISASGSGNVLFDKSTGVIGVACVLNLISGGWMLEEMGIPAQCVLLDYCGCKNHWHDEGLPTCINIDKLKFILNI